MPPRLLGSLVGGMIIFTNTRTIMLGVDQTGGLLTWWVLGGVLVLWVAAVWISLQAVLTDRRIARREQEPERTLTEAAE